MSLRSEALEQGLTTEEFDRIVGTLGREPNRAELGIFAVMWSEHCCYKSSKVYLSTLPTRGPMVLQGPGENAGVVDIGGGLVVVFKIESHNHPSFIEPHQGAATGVGGILRDVFTMGARPVAILDSLHFGEPSNARTGYLVGGVVGGIAGYGNCIGIPTVAGEVWFDRSYNGNILVNVMAVGVARREDLHKAVAKGAGNRVLYLGSRTGRDGIHGATMASEEFGAGNEERRPTVQVGDPFTGKLILEASLELAREKLLVGMQDMGAAGIACSTFEMSSKGGCGMDLELDNVPLREAGLSAWEIFLSESQERMLLCSKPENVPAVMEVARKWGVECADIGQVRDTKRVVARYRGETVVDLPVAPVIDDAPSYTRPFEVPKPASARVDAAELSGGDFSGWVRRLARSADLSSREAVWRQYDHMVGTDTVLLPGSDASVLRIKGHRLGLAMTVDSNGAYCRADPYAGTMHVVAEAARNLVCTGARPVAVTNCLNFGNPEDPAVMGQLRESVRGLGDACRMLETPVTGGNVSLYNQTDRVNIRPTPAVGMIGILEDVTKHLKSSFGAVGDQIALLGPPDDGRIYCSVFAREILERNDLACPPLRMEEEKILHRVILQLCGEGLLRSAHDVSSGGLVTALIESCAPGVGARIDVPEAAPAAFLFGEYAAQVLVSCPTELKGRVNEVAKNHGVTLRWIGSIGGESLVVGGLFQIPLAEIWDIRSSFFAGF